MYDKSKKIVSSLSIQTDSYDGIYIEEFLLKTSINTFYELLKKVKSDYRIKADMPDIKEIAPGYSYYYRGKRYNETDIAIHNLNKLELAKLDRI